MTDLLQPESLKLSCQYPREVWKHYWCLRIF